MGKKAELISQLFLVSRVGTDIILTALLLLPSLLKRNRHRRDRCVTSTDLARSHKGKLFIPASEKIFIPFKTKLIL